MAHIPGHNALQQLGQDIPLVGGLPFFNEFAQAGDAFGNQLFDLGGKVAGAIEGGIDRLTGNFIEPMSPEQEVEIKRRATSLGIRPAQIQELLSGPFGAAIDFLDQQQRTQFDLGQNRGLEQTFNEFFDKKISRNQGFLDNPNSLRTDAQLAGLLTNVENQVRGQERKNKRGAAQAQATATGGSITGRGFALDRGFTEQADRLISQNFGNVLGGLASDIEGFESNKLSGGQIFENNRRNIQEGFPSALDLFGVGVGADLTNFGVQGEAIGRLQSGLSVPFDLVNQAGTNALNAGSLISNDPAVRNVFGKIF